MKKFLMLSGVILLVAGLCLGAVGSYIYFSAGQTCAEMIARAQDSDRIAIAATGSAEAERFKKDAEYARKGAILECENSKERRRNSLIFGSGTLVLTVIAAAMLLFSRRTSRQFE